MKWIKSIKKSVKKPVQKTLSILLTAVVLFAAAPMMTREAGAAAGTPYYNWKQSDPQWKDIVLSSRTVGAVGCLATSIACSVVHAGLRTESNFDPGSFVRAMKAVGGFESNNNLIWEKVPVAVPGFQLVNPRVYISGTQQQKLQKIKSYYDQGYSVIAAVKNEGHWVAVRSVTSSAVTMMDPGSQATDLFGKYPTSGVTRLALFQPARPAATTQPAVPPAPAAVESDDFSERLSLPFLGVFQTIPDMDAFKEIFGIFWSVFENFVKAPDGLLGLFRGLVQFLLYDLPDFMPD
ncbi:MAG: hypothetical protein FWH26_05000 [Oscillospiraceae bacterium]|nr:hypothetical protein [Oscillospiraceae bacterium]